jgi:transglutaminase-like putative cysteine protease/tetratricopeptide (TPR) repeat protein
MIQFFRSFVLSVAFLVSAATCCSAAEGNRTWTLPRFSDDTAALYNAASSVTTPAGTEVSVLDEEETYIFDADGKAVRTRYLLYKVLTERGVEGWGGISVTWEPWREERPSVKARVITGDNAVHILDPKTINDAPAEEADEEIYSDGRILRAPLPAVAPGVLVEEEETIKESGSFFGAGTVTRYYFGRRGEPVQHTRLYIEAPASMQLRYKVELLPDLQPERSEVGGRVHLSFEVGAMESLEEPDDYVPSEMAVLPLVTFSTGNSWQRIAEEYGKIVDQQIAEADLKSLVGKLIARKDSREAKATAILQYLDEDVRYTGVEFGDAAIVPRTPAETLKRKYGDCKDKSSLLVAMLRAAGIPAYVALLNAGSRKDVARDLPGMGLFDHAIVYAPGAPDIWIDATDEHARLGQLPNRDQGRLALIARAETTALTSTPIASAEDNLLVEYRELHLPENGPGRIVEISEPHGALESDYRQSYENPQNKDRRKDLMDYVKTQYLAEKLDRFEVTDANDISKQFTLTLECSGAKRGATDLDSSVAAIRFDTLFSRLPKELQEQKKEEKNASSERVGDKPKKPRIGDYELPLAFVTEWRYKIVPPPGYRPKPLPPSAKVALGPAVLTKEFSADPDGVIHAVIRFDTVKRRFTVAESTEMRNQIAQSRQGQAILLYFEPVAQALLNEGKFRESFQAYRDMIAAHPKEALHHLQMAKALLAAGMGQAARDEAQAAVKVDPKSTLAQKTLAEILEYDLVGRKYRGGSDYAGAESAFRAAKALESEDETIVGNLALLLEYNSFGERYGTGAKLKASAAEYLSLTQEKLTGIGLQNNPAFTLFYAGEIAEAQKSAEKLNPQLAAVIVACEAAANGSQAGIAEARKRSGGDADFKQSLKGAGEMLMRARRYPQAADLLEAGASGDNASNTMGLAAILRKTRQHEEIHYNNDAIGAAMQVFALLADHDITVEKVMGLSSRNGREVMKRSEPEEIKRTRDVGRQTRRALSQTGYPSDVMLDVVLAAIEARTEGEDASGYRVTLKAPGQQDTVMYVVKEDGQYRVLDTSKNPSAIGLEALDRIHANDLKGARVLLDWVRDDQHLVGGDDPIHGYAFARIWTKGKEADAEHMKLAAAAILAQSLPTAQQALSILEPARISAPSEPDKLNLTIALIDAYEKLDAYENALAVCTELAKQYPDSNRLFLDSDWALRNLGRYEEADAKAQDWFKKKPDDMDALRVLIYNAEARGDYSQAHERSLKVVSAGKAEASDLNQAAWTALFTGKVDEGDLANIVRAAQLNQNNTSTLHTLGCVYAEIGKLKEAREVLIQAMDKLNLEEPDANYWYAFGRIAEQSGEFGIARANYAQVTKPPRSYQVPQSSYRLAQMRLKAMDEAAHKEPSPKK